MLGYLLRKTDYEADVKTIEEKIHMCSIRSIIEEQPNSEAKLSVLFGKNSLAQLLENQGISAVPLS